MRAVRFFLGDDIGQPVGEGLGLFPTHAARIVNARVPVNVRAPAAQGAWGYSRRMAPSSADLRRRVPAVESVLQREAVTALLRAHGRQPVMRELRVLLDELRQAASGAGTAFDERLEGLERELQGRLLRAGQPSLRPVLNATGVVVHTNLGRAPLSRAAAEQVAALARGYSNLEFDLGSGERGRRESHIEEPLGRLLSSEAALVVNNCAAAVMLAVNTLAEGREVLVSRGELVEIGGSFRIPDVLRKAGARLVEVGTTNRTRVADYRAALCPATALILKVHPSNFRILGFSESPGLEELADCARAAGLPLVEDLGSGYLGGLPALASEPTVSQSLAAGVDLVAFSGDKLLGGPQAGLLVGRRVLVEQLRGNPLYRALRVGKLTLAALAAVLAEHASGRALQQVTVAAFLALPAESVRARAEALARLLQRECPGVAAEVVPGASAVGGGAAPTLELPTWLITLALPECSAERLAARLRACVTPVVARIVDGRVALDLRTLPEHEQALLDASLLEALRACGA
jgi:L-seryl-tRNA(Ser) seleniumtransferase